MADTSLVLSQPSVAARPSRASMPSTSLPGKRRQASRNQSGSVSADVPITNRDSPKSNSSRTDCSSRMPPPSSHSISDRRQDVLHARQIDRQPFAGPFQIDDVQVLRALVGKLPGNGGRVLGEDGFLLIVALPEPDALSAPQINCRPDLHRKPFRKNRRPGRPK